MTTTTVVIALGVCLALLLASMAWGRDRPRWQIVAGPPGESPNRIPLTEFCLLAQRHGWTFSADHRLFLDLAMGLREAGLAGAIEIWGRPCDSKGPVAVPRAPLARIPVGFWVDHEISGLGAAIFKAGGSEETADELQARNASVQTRCLPSSSGDTDKTIYQDIHLNYLQAMDWLDTSADACKGASRRD